MQLHNTIKTEKYRFSCRDKCFSEEESKHLSCCIQVLKHPIMRIVHKSGTQTSYQPPTFVIGIKDYESTYGVGITKGSFNLLMVGISFKISARFQVSTFYSISF